MFEGIFGKNKPKGDKTIKPTSGDGYVETIKPTNVQPPRENIFISGPNTQGGGENVDTNNDTLAGATPVAVPDGAREVIGGSADLAPGILSIDEGYSRARDGGAGRGKGEELAHAGHPEVGRNSPAKGNLDVIMNSQETDAQIRNANVRRATFGERVD